MRYGLYLPNFGAECSARALADLAAEAEASGWDGFFIWDHILYSKSQKLPMVDPWVALAAIAMRTERIRIGALLTPVARRRPWKLARETATLDHLSNGRLILGAGLGEPAHAEFSQFGEQPDPKVRAAKLDEGLAILAGLWRGKPFGFQGEHYRLPRTTFWPPALQTPRIPIWVGGFWPNKPPFRRAARWDGVFPLKHGGGMKPKDLRDILAYIREHRASDTLFDVVLTGSTAGNNRKQSIEKIAPFAEVGLTWWLESLYRSRNSIKEMRARIRQGPPRL